MPGASEKPFAPGTSPTKKGESAGTVPFNRPCEPYAVTALTPKPAFSGRLRAGCDVLAPAHKKARDAGTVPSCRPSEPYSGNCPYARARPSTEVQGHNTGFRQVLYRNVILLRIAVRSLQDGIKVVLTFTICHFA